MIEFSIKNNLLILTYIPSQPWVHERFSNGEKAVLRKGTFAFSKEDLFSQIIDEEQGVEFVLGRSSDDYFKIEASILDVKQSIFIYKDIKLSESFFIAIQGIPIFKKIGDVVREDIYIGGENPEALPESEFRKLLRNFPNSYEIKKYVNARLGSVLSNYFDSASDVQSKYEQYMNKRQSIKGEDLSKEFKDGELIKYETILDKLSGMLEKEMSYNEKQWQNEILQIILLLYPKYIFTFTEAPVRDAHNSRKDKNIDFLLVDSNGNVDIIEIKRPMGEKIITKRTYRDNHIPISELSGTVMQIEKYIFHLNKSGQKGENRLTEKYKAKLPKKFKIRITNPSGIIIMGRDNDLSVKQKEDFEVVKRKYKNVADIITYDDLLRRLRAMISAMKKR